MPTEYEVIKFPDEGALVWAKLTGYPPWPSRIAALDEVGPTIQAAGTSGNKLVYFFGSDDYAWIKDNSIFDWDASFKDRDKRPTLPEHKKQYKEGKELAKAWRANMVKGKLVFPKYYPPGELPPAEVVAPPVNVSLDDEIASMFDGAPAQPPAKRQKVIHKADGTEAKLTSNGKRLGRPPGKKKGRPPKSTTIHDVVRKSEITPVKDKTPKAERQPKQERNSAQDTSSTSTPPAPRGRLKNPVISFDRPFGMPPAPLVPMNSVHAGFGSLGNVVKCRLYGRDKFNDQISGTIEGSPDQGFILECSLFGKPFRGFIALDEPSSANPHVDGEFIACAKDMVRTGRTILSESFKYRRGPATPHPHNPQSFPHSPFTAPRPRPPHPLLPQNAFDPNYASHALNSTTPTPPAPSRMPQHDLTALSPVARSELSFHRNIGRLDEVNRLRKLELEKLQYLHRMQTVQLVDQHHERMTVMHDSFAEQSRVLLGVPIEKSMAVQDEQLRQIALEQKAQAAERQQLAEVQLRHLSKFQSSTRAAQTEVFRSTM